MTLWTEAPCAVATYDAECVGRRDHGLYLTLAAELEASRVVDLGCGTGMHAALRVSGMIVVVVALCAALVVTRVAPVVEVAVHLLVTH